jgi:cytochrome c-type biogenesis protein CcmH/NrfG
MSRREMMFFVAGVALTTAFTTLFFAASHAETNTASVANAAASVSADITTASAVAATAHGSNDAASFDANTVRTAQLISNQPSANAGSLDDVTERLATRLASNGGSDADWRLLAESYDYLGKLQEAADARSHIAIASAQASRVK